MVRVHKGHLCIRAGDEREVTCRSVVHMEIIVRSEGNAATIEVVNSPGDLEGQSR